MNDRWYVVYNPASGKKRSKNRLQSLKELFETYGIPADIRITNYPRHEEELVQNAIRKGFRNLVCAGGDGTLHHMINGIMKQSMVPSSEICVAMIPSGTGNDWIKTYNIPTDAASSVEIINKGHRLAQDIGCIQLMDTKQTRYFVNVAGFGYDGFVVKNLSLFKRLGALAYLLTGLFGFFSYKPEYVSMQSESYSYTGRIFMVVLGIGKYSGGGMQLTDHNNHKEKLFDTTVVPDIGIGTVLLNLRKLYNGKVCRIKNVSCLQIKKMDILQNTGAWIQADGELLGQGSAAFHIVPKAVNFLVP